MTLAFWISVSLVGVPAAFADGIGADADLPVAQSVNGGELTVKVWRVGPVLGPLRVGAVTHRGDAPDILQLTASAPGATANGGQVEVDRTGPRAVIVHDRRTAARIPFLVPAQVVPP